ncbi:MAG: hypothetical protein LBK46_04625 [Oscillospiraceae bacterium]|nr:hypothetical protein [Oscillospiraceae bacterium]
MQPTRHGFIGAYTRDGYVMFDPERMLGGNAERRIRVRGGYGKARASAIAAAVKRILERGYEADVLHSPLEPELIEGVVCPRLSLIITSADTCDPCDTASVCIDLDEALRTVRSGARLDAIKALAEETLSYESRVIRYMEAAAPLRADAEDEYARVFNQAALDSMLRPWIESITAYREDSGDGVESRFFVEAITARGFIQHLDTVIMPRLWRLSGPWGSDFHAPLSKLRDAALSKGLHVMCAMEHCQPGRIAHLLIPELGLFITSEVSVHVLADAAQRTIDLRLAMPAAETFSQHTLHALAYDELMVEQLMEKAAYALDLARQTRQRIDRMREEYADEQVMRMMTEAALAVLEQAFADDVKRSAYDFD